MFLESNVLDQLQTITITYEFFIHWVDLSRHTMLLLSFWRQNGKPIVATISNNYKNYKYSLYTFCFCDEKHVLLKQKYDQCSGHFARRSTIGIGSSHRQALHHKCDWSVRYWQQFEKLCVASMWFYLGNLIYICWEWCNWKLFSMRRAGLKISRNQRGRGSVQVFKLWPMKPAPLLTDSDVLRHSFVLLTSSRSWQFIWSDTGVDSHLKSNPCQSTPTHCLCVAERWKSFGNEISGINARWWPLFTSRLGN